MMQEQPSASDGEQNSNFNISRDLGGANEQSVEEINFGESSAIQTTPHRLDLPKTPKTGQPVPEQELLENTPTNQHNLQNGAATKEPRVASFAATSEFL